MTSEVNCGYMKKVCSLEYDDGFGFRRLLENGRKEAGKRVKTKSRLYIPCLSNIAENCPTLPRNSGKVVLCRFLAVAGCMKQYVHTTMPQCH